MSVLTEVVGRGDVILYRGVSNRWGVRWERSADGVTFEPVDLTGWVGMLELRSVRGEAWLGVAVTTSADGLTTIVVAPDDLSDPIWGGRAGGSWVVNLTAPDGHVERLGQGYFHLEA